ncbi:hypothetical protein GGH95_004419, partial [Coemansia sp. RSA 1836]
APAGLGAVRVRARRRRQHHAGRAVHRAEPRADVAAVHRRVPVCCAHRLRHPPAGRLCAAQHGAARADRPVALRARRPGGARRRRAPGAPPSALDAPKGADAGDRRGCGGGDRRRGGRARALHAGADGGCSQRCGQQRRRGCVHERWRPAGCGRRRPPAAAAEEEARGRRRCGRAGGGEGRGPGVHSGRVYGAQQHRGAGAAVPGRRAHRPADGRPGRPHSARVHGLLQLPGAGLPVAHAGPVVVVRRLCVGAALGPRAGLGHRRGSPLLVQERRRAFI